METGRAITQEMRSKRCLTSGPRLNMVPTRPTFRGGNGSTHSGNPATSTWRTSAASLLAHVTWEKNHQGIVGWRAMARDEAARWMGAGVLDPIAECALNTLWSTPEDAIEQAEIEISHAAFDTGTAPNPEAVPAIFLLGKIIRGRALLLEI